MDEYEWTEESWRQDQARMEEQWRQRVAAEEAWWKARTDAQQDEFLRQNNLMYGGLIGIGIVMVQPFLTAAPEAFDLTARICVIAFSVAIPILAALVLLNSQEMYRQRMVKSAYVQAARAVALGFGFVGVAAGFWHLTPIAGVAVLVAAMVAVSVQSVGYVRVEREDARATSEGGDDGDPPR